MGTMPMQSATATIVPTDHRRQDLMRINPRVGIRIVANTKTKMMLDVTAVFERRGLAMFATSRIATATIGIKARTIASHMVIAGVATILNKRRARNW